MGYLYKDIMGRFGGWGEMGGLVPAHVGHYVSMSLSY